MVFVWLANRRSINTRLDKLDLAHPRPKIWPYWLSPTIGRLGAIKKSHPKKYEAYIQLIESLITIARNSKDFRMYTLHLPSVEALKGIPIETLMQNPEARTEIDRQCYKFEQKSIDLRKLITVTRQFLSIVKK
jgi:hypothetical protein